MDDRFFLYFEDVDGAIECRPAGGRFSTTRHPLDPSLSTESARRPGKDSVHLASTFRYYEKWSFLLYWLKRRSSAIRRMVLIISDLAAVNLAFLVAYGARSASGILLTKPMFGLGRYLRFLAFTDAVALACLALAGMYRSRRREEAGEQLLGTTRAVAATALIMMASTFVAPPVYSRVVVGFPRSLGMILLFRWMIARRREDALQLQRGSDCLLLQDAGRSVAGWRNPFLGIEILPLTTRAALLGRPRGGSPSSFEDATLLWVHDERIAEIVLFEDWSESGPEELITRLTRAGIPVRLVPRLRSTLGQGSRMGDFLGLPALQLSNTNLAGRSWEKRLLDIVLSLVSTVVCFIPYLVALAALRAGGGGLAVRKIVGRSGRPILVRSLPEPWPRGAFTGVAEFPTLLLWLRGDWSLVGIHPFDWNRWGDLPEGYRRFPPDAPPGWITLAGRGDRDPGEICAANQEYVGRWSLALDLNLVLERIRRRKGNR
jgi:lipopolysaccharide/colanic/teichoic acid biosynthesis glycosyltransferase